MGTQNTNEMDGLSGFFRDLWRSFTIGDSPNIHHHHLVENIEPGRGLKHRVTRRTNLIINEHAGKNHKFGKSGQPPQKADKDEYRKAPYSKMYLLYKSKNPDHVSELEVYYIKRYKHLKKNDNVSEALNHGMRSYDGHYYLYLVI
jgi:hypothetical protein